MSFFRRILRAPDPNPDGIDEAQMVRVKGWRGVWIVESIEENHAIITRDGRHREIVPLILLRSLPQRGWFWDSRVGKR